MKKYVLLEKIHYFAEWCPLVFMKKISKNEGADEYHWKDVKLVCKELEVALIISSLEIIEDWVDVNSKGNILDNLKCIMCVEKANGWSLPLHRTYIMNSSSLLQNGATWTAGKLVCACQYIEICRQMSLSLPLFSHGNNTAKLKALEYSLQMMREINVNETELQLLYSTIEKNVKKVVE